MSTLQQVFRPILLDCASFGLNGSGDLTDEADDLAAYLPKLAEDFSLQVTIQAINHLRSLRRVNSGDFDALQIEALLDRALFRVVPQADLNAIVGGLAAFHEPPPFVAVTTETKELDFPLTIHGTNITSLSASVGSTWREQAVDHRIQVTSGKVSRHEIWVSFFKHFIFGPQIMISDPYLLSDLVNCAEKRKSYASNSGFGYLLKKISEEAGLSSKNESEFQPRSLHILTSADKQWPNAKQWQSDYVAILKSAVEEVLPNIDVEFTVTDKSDPRIPGKAIFHQRSVAVGHNGKIRRLLIPDTSIGSYFGKDTTDAAMSFSYLVNPKFCQPHATTWSTLTSRWRDMGFRYKWTNPSALT
jgi:hypothetical protein